MTFGYGNIKINKNMKIQSYSKSQLAYAYAPNIGQRAALYRLSSWIRLNHDLTAALAATGYIPSQRIFTSRQVELIFHYLGEP